MYGWSCVFHDEIIREVRTKCDYYCVSCGYVFGLVEKVVDNVCK